MYDFSKAIDGLFYAFAFAIAAALILAAYVVWQAVFSLTPWDICSKMETDKSKIQCMEIHND